MRLSSCPRASILLWISVSYVLLLKFSCNGHDQNGHYVNDWAAEIPGGEEAANLVARELGYENLGKLVGIDDHYLLRRSDTPTRSKRDATHHTTALKDHPQVRWAEQQLAKRRDKRTFINLNLFNRRNNGPYDYYFIDPEWPKQWYLHDTRTSEALPPLDLNVIQAWIKGYTGKNISVCILDDGLEHNNTDIAANYDPFASYDVNDNDTDPFPRYDVSNSNRHGTRCAGEVAMIANNTLCGVGVAYNAKIGGIRMLDGKVTDSNEAVSVGFNCTHVDIYSASWGPTDNGETVDGPGKLTSAAMERCIREGRGGKGVLYVWASGNGGGKGDNCDCDGYINSIYSISINSVAENGHFPWYAEMCASTMACTYSGGAYMDQKVVTVDLHNGCTDTHSGTSAAAPLAAGAFALVLEANPNLTWRDAQHLLVCTAEDRPIIGNPGWQSNGIGLRYNQRFGFGMMNVGRMCEVAPTWKNVPEKTICEVSSDKISETKLSSSNKIEVTFDATKCNGTNPLLINYLEHVQVILDLNYTCRGALEVQLFSANDSQSQLLNPRKADKSDKGFRNWTFMSVHFWGENPKGMWKLVISDKTSEKNTGFMNSVKLILHGTAEMPAYRQNGIKCGTLRSSKLPPPAPNVKVNQRESTKPTRNNVWSNFMKLFTK